MVSYIDVFYINWILYIPYYTIYVVYTILYSICTYIPLLFICTMYSSNNCTYTIYISSIYIYIIVVYYSNNTVIMYIHYIRSKIKRKREFVHKLT